MWDRIDSILQRHRNMRGALIPVLQQVQQVVGFLPPQVQQYLAQGLGVSPAEVFGVATFYAFFSLEPRGRHHCKVCLGTACYVRGSNKLMDNLTETFGLKKSGGTTADLRLTVEGVRCVGACGLAPVMIVGEDVHRKVDVVQLPEIMKRYE